MNETCNKCSAPMHYNEDLFERGVYCSECTNKDVEQFNNCFIVDTADNFILFKGTLNECEETIETLYGGLMILHEFELPENITNLGEYQ